MIGLTYAITSLSAEYTYSVSPQSTTSIETLHTLERAARLFPFDARYRRGPAMWLIFRRWSGSRPLAIETCRRLLATDPNDLDIRLGLAGLLIEDGDREGARAELDRVHEAVPSAKLRVVVNVNPATR